MESCTCASCSTTFEGNYCPTCGQRKLILPFDGKSVLRNIVELLEFDRGFFFTLFSLFTRPAGLIQRFLQGDTIRYNNPFRFLVTSIAFLAILDLIRTYGRDEEVKVLLIAPPILLLSLLTAAFTKIAFQYTWTFTEHLIISIYLSAAIFFIITLPTFIMMIVESLDIAPYNDKLSLAVTMPLFLSYMFYFTYSVYPGRKVHVILKTLLYLGLLVGVFLSMVYVIRSFNIT